MNQEIAEALLGWEEFPTEDDYKEISEEILEKTRWSIIYERIYHNVKDDTYWSVSWSRGATEYQDEGSQDIEFSQVYPHVVQTTVFKGHPQDV